MGEDAEQLEADLAQAASLEAAAVDEPLDAGLGPTPFTNEARDGMAKRPAVGCFLRKLIT